MRFGIATYHRKDIKTIDVLRTLGVRDEDILIATQDAKDFEYLSKKYPECKFICDETITNVSGNRNQIMGYAASNDISFCMILDDDILGFDTQGKNGYECLDDCISFMQKEDIVNLNIGHKLCRNPHFLNTLIDWHWDGQCNVVDVKRCPRYRLDYDIREDTAFGFDILRAGLHSAYTTKYVAECSPWGGVAKTEGGCAEFYAKDKFKGFGEKLVNDYPEYFFPVPMSDPSGRDYVWFHSPTKIVYWK